MTNHYPTDQDKVGETCFLGRTTEEILDALFLWDQAKMPKDEAMAGLKELRDGYQRIGSERHVKILNAGMIAMAELLLENEKLRREREDLRMFCKGVARNIEGMLNT